MMTRKNNVSMKGLNDNINHKNVAIILISVCLQMKSRLKSFICISRYNFIPVLKNGIRNTVFCTFASRKPVYLGCMNMRSRR